MTKNPPANRQMILLICSVDLLFVGIIYAWSIFKVPLLAAFHCENAQLAYVYTATICCFCMGSLLAGLLSRILKVSTRMILGAALILTGFSATGLSTAERFEFLFLTYSAPIGFGVGIVYNTLLSVGNKWYPERKGFSSGTMMMFFGFSSLLLGNAASALFAAAGIGWRKTFILFGVTIFLILCFSTGGISEPDPADAAGQKPSSRKAPQDYSPKEMVHRRSFWMFYAQGILGAAVGSAVFSFARELILLFGTPEYAAVILVGVMSVCNGLGRILCGLCVDAAGLRKTMLLTGAIVFCAPAVMLMALARNSVWLAGISLCLTGISYGCVPTIGAVLISSFYGTRHFSVNYGISNTRILFSAFSATVAASLFRLTNSYVAPYLFLLSVAFLSAVLCFFIRKP